MKSVPIIDVFAKQSAFKKGGEKDRRITEAVINMIIKDSLPFITTEKGGFKNLMRVCTFVEGH